MQEFRIDMYLMPSRVCPEHRAEFAPLISAVIRDAQIGVVGGIIESFRVYGSLFPS